MGVFGGGIYHFIRGWRNAARGYRLQGALSTVRLKAPATGGGFALWGFSFCTFDCTFIYLRQKEDPWNAIMAGAATGAFQVARAGTRQMLMGAAIGGILLGMIEGMNLMVGRFMNQQARMMTPQIVHKPKPPPPPPTNPFGIPTGEPARCSNDIGFNDPMDLAAEDRF